MVQVSDAAGSLHGTRLTTSATSDTHALLKMTFNTTLPYALTGAGYAFPFSRLQPFENEPVSGEMRVQITFEANRVST